MSKAMKNLAQGGLTLLGIGALVIWQTGYNPFMGSGEPGEIITAEKLHALKKDVSSEGKRVSVIGHGSLPNSDVTLKIGQPYSMPIADKNGQLIDFFRLDHGDGKNEFYMPTTFKPEDLALYDNEGKKHVYNEDVRISFTMKRIKEAEPEKDPATGEYSWDYDQVRIDPVAGK